MCTTTTLPLKIWQRSTTTFTILVAFLLFCSILFLSVCFTFQYNASLSLRVCPFRLWRCRRGENEDWCAAHCWRLVCLHLHRGQPEVLPFLSYCSCHAYSDLVWPNWSLRVGTKLKISVMIKFIVNCVENTSNWILHLVISGVYFMFNKVLCLMCGK